MEEPAFRPALVCEMSRALAPPSAPQPGSAGWGDERFFQEFSMLAHKERTIGSFLHQKYC